MLVLATALGLLLYLAPIVLAVAAACRRDTTARAMAILVPCAVALDLLVVLTIARVTRLEWAILASRPLELGVLGWWIARRRPERPVSLDRRCAAAIAASAGAAAALSVCLSRPYAIWDRGWHELLASALRAQRIPFSNVYEPNTWLPYHFTGDVLAATLQTLSFGAIHSARALSLEHDLTFALAGACLALVLVDAKVKSAAACAAATLLMLLAGPATALHLGPTVPVSGWSIHSYLTLSYRPHTCLAGLLMLGILAAVLPRDPRPPLRITVPALLVLVAVMGITDEVSTAMLVGALGVAWVVAPTMVHESRLRGALVLGAMPLAALATNVAFAAAFAPGAPRTPMRILPFHFAAVSEVSAATAPLHPLVGDFLPTGLVALGLAILAARSPRARGPAALACGLTVVGALLLTHIDVNHNPGESHRFVTAALVLVPAIAATTFASLRPSWGLAPVLALAGAALGATSTLEWLVAVAPSHCETHSRYFQAGDLWAASCHAIGARLGTEAVPTYVEANIAYLYAGCTPTTLAAAPPGYWRIQVSGPLTGEPELAALDARFVKPDQPLVAICMARPRVADRACDYARDHALCGEATGTIRRCSLPPEARRAILAKPR